MKRPADKLLDDIIQAADVAREIVRLSEDVPRLRAAIERYRGRA